ncbi:hypothetical protein GLYMA_15G271650v4 [Glycine max]|nr:hypothetical protein GLYMA_15G271650v4 [Glycine max]KAH1149083.1 hypothetical protein GYH30_043614 [Glycine max]
MRKFNLIGYNIIMHLRSLALLLPKSCVCRFCAC